MTYLTNPLSHTLAMPDFSSSASGLKHFGDVKHLFHLAQAVFILLAYPSWLFGKIAELTNPFSTSKTFAFAAILPILIAVVGILIGFDQFLPFFMKCYFQDSSWLFNPATDPIIWVLPEEYFMHCFIIFFVTYEALMLSLLVIARKQLAERLVHHGKEKG